MPTILTKRSSTAGAVPTSSQLTAGETAVNTADAYLYVKHTDGSVKRIGTTADSVHVNSTGIIPEGSLQDVLVAIDAAYLTQTQSDARYALASSLAYRPGHTYTANDWAWLDKPGGLIIQWGTVIECISETDYRYFPIAFPSECFSCNLSIVKSALWGFDSSFGIISQVIDGSKFIASVEGSFSAGGVTMTYIAIGI